MEWMTEQQMTSPYPYAKKPLSGDAFLFIMYKLFAGKSERRRLIIKAVREYHIQQQGLFDVSQDANGIDSKATKALQHALTCKNAVKEPGAIYTFVESHLIVHKLPVASVQLPQSQIHATSKLREGLAQLQGHRCGAINHQRTWGCRNKFGYGIRRLPLHYADVDHVIPRSRGGEDNYSNLQLLCKSCHARKSANERGELCRIGVVYTHATRESDTKRLDDRFENDDDASDYLDAEESNDASGESETDAPKLTDSAPAQPITNVPEPAAVTESAPTQPIVAAPKPAQVKVNVKAAKVKTKPADVVSASPGAEVPEPAAVAALSAESAPAQPNAEASQPAKIRVKPAKRKAKPADAVSASPGPEVPEPAAVAALPADVARAQPIAEVTKPAKIKAKPAKGKDPVPAVVAGTTAFVALPATSAPAAPSAEVNKPAESTALPADSAPAQPSVEAPKPAKAKVKVKPAKVRAKPADAVSAAPAVKVPEPAAVAALSAESAPAQPNADAPKPAQVRVKAAKVKAKSADAVSAAPGAEVPGPAAVAALSAESAPTQPNADAPKPAKVKVNVKVAKVKAKPADAVSAAFAANESKPVTNVGKVYAKTAARTISYWPIFVSPAF